MLEAVRVRSPSDVVDFLGVPATDSLEVEALRTHAPQASLLVRDADGRPRARCSLWWGATPRLDGATIALIGHYAASDDAAAAVLLKEAKRLVEGPAATMVGPMDGSTWRRYRFVTDPGTEPPFFLEPMNPPAWPRQFEAAGFTPVASYVSSLTHARPPTDPRVASAQERLSSHGITLRPLDVSRFDQSLDEIHGLSLRSFENNFLYTPIPREEFVAQYKPLRSHVDPRIVLVAEQGGRLVGYSFALPDLLQAKRGAKVDTAILKTLAVDPDLAGQGLGGVLTARTLEACWDSGYARVIGALMQVDNRSRRISEHYATPMRGYTLFQHRIAGDS